MLKCSSPARRRGQWSLIGTLVAVALLVLLAALYIPRMLKPSVGETGAEQSALQRANGVACTEYLSQFNAAAMSYKDANGRPPSSLEDLKKEGITDEMIHSPGCSFQMDPSTGRVTNGSAPGVPGGSPPGGSPAPVTYGQPPSQGGAPAPSPNGGGHGPGGITIPPITGGGY